MGVDRTDIPERLRAFDVVALARDLLDSGLIRGQVGTVVEVLAPGVFEVEFSDDNGRCYAELAISDDALIDLHYAPVMTT